MSFFVKVEQSTVPVPTMAEVLQFSEWLAPPRLTTPGRSAQQAVLFRTDTVMCEVGRFEAYATGVQLDVALYVRGNIEIADMPWAPSGRHRGRDSDGVLLDDFLRLGVEFADGRIWSNTVESFLSGDVRPEGPSMQHCGGGGGSGRWRSSYWLWPLPPEGDLRLFAKWPAFGVDEVAVTIDATELRQRSLDAQSIW